MLPKINDLLKNAHTGETRIVESIGGGAVCFRSANGKFNEIHDRWNTVDINIHWQNLTQGENEKVFGPYGFQAGIIIGNSGLMHRVGQCVEYDKSRSY